MFVCCLYIVVGFPACFQSSFLIKEKEEEEEEEKKKKKEKKGKKKKFVAAEGAKAIARFVLPRENPESHTKTNAEGYMDSWT